MTARWTHWPACPSANECNDAVQAILTANKIKFPPGSVEIDAEASKIVAQMAKALEKCGAITFEIAGHTDAQGSDGGNLALSQARAEAVLLALQGRQVDVSGMVAKGYGEGVPVADNGTEAGREANRRIEFTFVAPASDATGNSPTEENRQGPPPRRSRPAMRLISRWTKALRSRPRKKPPPPKPAPRKKADP